MWQGEKLNQDIIQSHGTECDLATMNYLSNDAQFQKGTQNVLLPYKPNMSSRLTGPPAHSRYLVLLSFLKTIPPP